tara:strand:+ start:804 stop:1250 length:447 start_codon:yes stop_codon:yes gene_type:complete
MAKNDKISEILKDINWNRLLLTVIPLLQPFIIFGSWVLFARLNTKASVVSKFVAIAEAIPALDLGIPKEVVLASLYDFSDDTINIVDKLVDTIMDPAGLQATKDALTSLKELAVEGETTVGNDFKVKVTIDDLLKFVGLDDDIIRSRK